MEVGVLIIEFVEGTEYRFCVWYDGPHAITSRAGSMSLIMT